MFLVEISLSDSLWFAKKSYLPWTLVLHLQLVIIWQYDVIFFLKSTERYQSPGKDGHGLRGSRNETTVLIMTLGEPMSSGSITGTVSVKLKI
jgi:hypothetical protein